MAQRKLKIVKLLEPELCLDCLFAKMADVELPDGTQQRMVFCERLDCDNWDFSSAVPIDSAHVDGESEART
ncbi:MAG: hypothetical protein AAB613_00770 [Patescibacteria group bacterium]